MVEIISQINEVGFPTVISVYLLIRFEGKITSLTNSITNLEKQIEKLSKN